jgi:hypothetical protein
MNNHPTLNKYLLDPSGVVGYYKGIPILQAFRLKGNAAVVWCQHCKRWHEHCAEIGHRVAHCGVHPEGYPKGYFVAAINKGLEIP